MRLSSLHARILVVTLVIFGVVATLSAVLTMIILRRHLTDEYVSKGTAIAGSIAAQAVDLILNRDPATVQAAMDEYLQIEGVAFVYVRDDTGRIISHTFTPKIPDEMISPPGDPTGIRVVEHMASPAMGDHIHITAPVLAGAAGYVHVGMDTSIITRHLWSAGMKHQGLMLAIFLASSVALYLLVNRIARPLTELTGYAARLAAKDFDAPMRISAGGEVGALAGTMRFMAGEISGLVAGLTREVDRATSDLKQTLSRLQAIIGDMADGLLVLDQDGRITLANPALGQMFGLDPEELPGQEAEARFGAVVADLAHQAMEAPGQAAGAEVALDRGRTAKGTATAILDHPDSGAPHIRGAVILFRDITREKEIDSIKTDFITTVSHELRTPLTSVLGFAKLIRRKLGQDVFPRLPDGREDTQKAVRQVNTNLHIISTEGQRLKYLIDDVLDISKMESGRVEWHMTPFSLAEAAADAAASTGPLYRKKRLEFANSIPEDLPAILGDRDRVIQVLVNLISNAVKFTPSGAIRLSAGTDEDRVVVRVEDTGVGIAPEYQDRIFEKFRQAGDTLTDKPKGTGLGLAICKQIVEHHGGRIWVRSAPGAGSTFFFTLPAYRDSGSSIGPAE
ncbi:MAG: ATP-binding protein [Thermodesulfobacteriota bacterium]